MGKSIYLGHAGCAVVLPCREGRGDAPALDAMARYWEWLPCQAVLCRSTRSSGWPVGSNIRSRESSRGAISARLGLSDAGKPAQHSTRPSMLHMKFPRVAVVSTHGNRVVSDLTHAGGAVKVSWAEARRPKIRKSGHVRQWTCGKSARSVGASRVTLERKRGQERVQQSRFLNGAVGL